MLTAECTLENTKVALMILYYHSDLAFFALRNKFVAAQNVL